MRRGHASIKVLQCDAVAGDDKDDDEDGDEEDDETNCISVMSVQLSPALRSRARGGDDRILARNALQPNAPLVCEQRRLPSIEA